jgi:hypothetical protein
MPAAERGVECNACASERCTESVDEYGRVREEHSIARCPPDEVGGSQASVAKPEAKECEGSKVQASDSPLARRNPCRVVVLWQSGCVVGAG